MQALILVAESGTLVHLEGSSGRSNTDSTEDDLTYKWTQTNGPGVTLNDPTSPNPTFIAPNTSERAEITFRLIVTNGEGTASEPDEVKITVNPTRTTTSEEADDSKTINDVIRDIIKNPLNITDSIDSADRLRDVLTHNS